MSYIIPSYEERPSSAHQYFVYWKPASGSEVYIALQNTSASSILVQPSLQIAGQAVALKQRALGPNQMQTLHFPDDLDAAGTSLWAANAFGGISLHVVDSSGQDAQGSSLNTSGWVEDDDAGILYDA